MAELAGGRIEIDVVPNLDNFNSTLNRGLNGALKIGAAFGVSFGAATAFSEIVSLGNDLTNTLNTMQSVSSATASEMAAVSARAKELGNDISLSNTSATDAAAAMTELAKGGFTVQQAMDGAKGTLQLAAAAGIDAASAATIQSQALQAFGLSADYAATAADVLANAANASSAEITDISAGLQQSGAVANQFGLTIEDTAATLGVLSNAGIAGSDAGTLLKSALLALTDTGKPAQAAIKDLGLTVYDAQGQFVGMSSLFGQLDTAAASMTPELYQAATATLFGSDAMRLAGVAAEQGQVGYDKMHTAIERQGAAAEVAAAKSKGLPGAMASIQNSAETLALELYDLIDGPMENFARDGADKLTNASSGIVDGFKTVGSTVAPVVGVLGSAATAIGALPGPVLAATGALVALRVTGVGSALAGAMTATTAATSRFTTAMAAQAFAAAAAGRQMGVLGAATAVVGARVGGAGGALKSMMGALGGPLVLGIVAAGAAIYSLNSEFNKAEKQQDLLTGSSTAMAAAQRDVAKAFQASQGAVSDDVLGAVGVQFDTFLQKQNELASTAPGSMAIFKAAGQDIAGWFSGVAEAGTDALNSQEEVAGAAERMKGAFDRTGLSTEELAGKISGTQSEFDTFAAVLRNSGEGGEEAADKVAEMRDEFQRARDIAKNVTPGFYDMSTAIKTLGDESATSEDRVNAIMTALDVMSGKQIPLSDAVQKYNDTIRETVDATADAIDPTRGFGDALIGANGAVNTQTENGAKLRDTMRDLARDTANVTEATIAAALEQGDSLPAAQEKARAAIASNEQALLNLANTYGVPISKIREMAEAEGLLPEDIIMLASLENAGTVTEQLKAIGLLLDDVGQPLDIEVTALSDEARAKIVELGGTVETDINGKPGVVRITAPTQEALDAIRAIDASVRDIPDKRVVVTIDTALTAKAQRDFNRNGVQGPVAPVLIPDKATGGRLPTTGPGTGVVDGILGVTSAGKPIANVDAGEWIVNRNSSEEYDRELAMINAGTFPKLPGFKGGGVVGGMQEWVDQVAPGLSMTSGLRNTDDGYHSTGNAADFSNGSGNTPEQLALAQAISEAYPDSLELIYDDPAFAGQEIKNGQRVDSSFYDGAGDHTNHVHWAMSAPPSLDRLSGGIGGVALSERDQIAQAIIEEGKRRAITRNGIRAALAAGLAESDLQNLPYGDRDSTGVFQQRNNGAWGTAEDRMDPTRAAGMFYEQLAKFDYESMDAAAAAQRVQQSGYSDGSNYAARMSEADALLAASDAGSITSTALGFEGAANSKWAEKDKLALDSAMVSVRQAQEDRDAVFANDKKTQADREQADLKVAKAEQRVRDLELKRDTATASKDDKTPAPDAPELTTNFSDEEIGLKSAELAVEKARLARNEVYAEAGVTEAEKLDADLSLQRAKNALDAERKNQAEGGTSANGGSATASSPVDLIGNVAKSFVTGQLGDALGVIGLSEDMGSIGALVTGIANYKSVPVEGGNAAEGLQQLFGKPFSEQLGMAAEASPDKPFDPQEWMRKMAEQIAIPAVLRDSGGPLPHGMAALNMSGDTEHVYTGKQNSDMFQELASIRAAVGGQNSGGQLDLTELNKQVAVLAENSSRPNVTYNTENIQQAIREETLRQTRQSRSFTRR